MRRQPEWPGRRGRISCLRASKGSIHDARPAKASPAATPASPSTRFAINRPASVGLGYAMSIEIIPTGAALGAEIRGVDLAAALDDETFGKIERAYNEHGVIFFRNQQITPS